MILYKFFVVIFWQFSQTWKTAFKIFPHFRQRTHRGLWHQEKIAILNKIIYRQHLRKYRESVSCTRLKSVQFWTNQFRVEGKFEICSNVYLEVYGSVLLPLFGLNFAPWRFPYMQTNYFRQAKAQPIPQKGSFRKKI